MTLLMQKFGSQLPADSCCAQLSCEIGGRRWEEDQWIELGWHICRTKFAREITRATKFVTKNAPKLSLIFLSLYFVGLKNPANFPQNLPKLPCEKLKKITSELLQGCMEKIEINP